jgi:hypothetical protein
LFYQEHGQHFCRKHVINWLKIAQEREDEEAITKIGAIIQCKQQTRFWQKMTYVTGKKGMRSTTSVQVEDQSGAILEHTTKETVEDSLFSEVHNKRYTMAGEALICNGELFKDFGHMANTLASKAVLDGTYIAPQDIDTATRELLAEIAAIRCIIPSNSVVIFITPDQ